MRWTILIVNLLAAGMFLVVAIVFPGVHRARIGSAYLYWKSNGAFVEKPRYAHSGEPMDVKAELERVASIADLVFLLYLAGAVCLSNGIVFFFYSRRGMRGTEKRTA